VLKRVMSRREKQLPVLPEGHENMSQTQVTSLLVMLWVLSEVKQL